MSARVSGYRQSSSSGGSSPPWLSRPGPARGPPMTAPSTTTSAAAQAAGGRGGNSDVPAGAEPAGELAAQGAGLGEPARPVAQLLAAVARVGTCLTLRVRGGWPSPCQPQPDRRRPQRPQQHHRERRPGRRRRSVGDGYACGSDSNRTTPMPGGRSLPRRSQVSASRVAPRSIARLMIRPPCCLR